MKLIIVPTDFSNTSAAAIRFGAYLAGTMKMELRVLHVFDTMISIFQTVSARARDAEQAILDSKLREFTHRNVEPVFITLRGRVDQPPVVTSAAVEGMAAQTVLWQSAQEETGLIVMGGVGTGAGLNPPGIFGNVARTVALKGACPVILVPEDYGHPRIERIALAFDVVEDIRQMSAFSRRVIAALKPEVHFVHVCQQGWKVEAEREEQFLELACGPGFPNYTFKFDSLASGEVTEKLLNYIKDKNINLLTLRAKRQGFFERLFEPSRLGAVVNRCEVPLLIIPAER